MKILYVITRSDHGGAQVAVLDLIHHLPPGFHPVVAAGESGYLQDECEKAGVPFRYVPGLVQPIAPILDLCALMQLTSLIWSEKPTLVHSHTSKAGMLARLAARITGTPSVFTAHTWSFDEGVPSMRRRISVPLERLGAALGGKIITVSDANTRKALRHSITSQKNMVRVWNGVPDTPLRARPGTTTPLTMITIARMVHQKDHATLLHAVSTLEGNWRIQLVGDGPERTALEALTAELGLTQRVTFFGERQDVAHLLSQADIFILPSKWEGLPISILEAMRAGLPVIASDVGGVSEAVIGGETGFLTRPRDVDHLRAQIRHLIETPHVLARIGKAGRERYEREFRIEVTARKTVEIYEEVCRGTKEAPVYVHSEEAG